MAKKIFLMTIPIAGEDEEQEKNSQSLLVEMQNDTVTLDNILIVY